MWYVMQVRTGTEENIRCQCQRLISSDILKRCFIPYYQQKKRFQGKWHIQERILFPGYVFLIAENLEQLAENLRKVTGMTRLLGTGDEIIPLSQEEVELLLKLGKEEQLVAMSTGIIENDQVRILQDHCRAWKVISEKSTDTKEKPGFLLKCLEGAWIWRSGWK